MPGPSNVGAVLGAMASAAVIFSFLRGYKRQPARLAPGVTYEASVRVKPKVDNEVATRMAAGGLAGTDIAITQGRTATSIRFRFVAVSPREVVPGETLFQLEGRKAVLASIHEV